MHDESESSRKDPNEYGAEGEEDDPGETCDYSMRQSDGFCFIDVEPEEARYAVESSVSITKSPSTTAASTIVASTIVASTKASVVASILCVAALAWMVITPVHVSLSAAILRED